MSEERVRVLLLDDEESLRVPLKRFLEKNFGYHVDAIASGGEALQKVEEVQGHYDVALIDEVLLDKRDGIQVMEEIKARYPDIECIVFTGWGTESRQRALQAGAFRYLEKPFDNDELAMLIRTAAQQVRLRDIGRAILLERDPDRALERIDAAASSLALADEAAITLLDPDTGKVQVHAKTHPGKTEWKKHFKDRDLSKEIIQTGQMVRVPDTKQDDRVNPEVIEAGIRSFVGVPIPGEGGNLGVLYVYSRQPGRFDEGSTVAVLQTLASQAGLAIANARAFQQTQAHAGYMEALVQAGQGLTRTTHLEGQLAIAWDFVRNQLKVATFFVGLYDKQVDVLRFPLAYDEGQPIEIPDRRLGDDPKRWGIAGYVVKTGLELCWFTQEDVRELCRSLGIKGTQVGRPCQSCFYLPIKMGDEVIGAISIQSYDRYAFTPTLLDACRALGGQLAVALENARLFGAEAQQRQEAETLREIALALTTTLEQQEIFERILSELQKVVPYDSASVQLLKGDWLEIIAGRGFPNLSEILGASFPVDGDNPNREVMRKQAPLSVSDAQAEYPGFSQKPLVQADIHGWLGVPMLIGDRLIGMIALDKHELGFYGEKHTRLAQTFAAQAAVAIENARLFQEREFLLETSKMVSSAQDLDQSLQTLAERLVHSLVVTFCRISLLGDTGKILTTRAAYPIVGDLAWNPGIGQQYLLSEAPDEAGAIETSQSQILRREENPGLLSSLERKTGFPGVLKTAALIPLTVGGKVFGVITLGERRSWERGSFVLERVVLCESAADQVAALILRMRLQEQAERNLVNIRRLYEASSRIGSMLDPDQTMRFIVEKACQAVEGWRAASVLLDEDGTPHGLSAVGFDKNLAAATSIRADGISTEVVKTGEPYLIEDVKAQADKVNPAMIQDGVQAAMCLPLRLGESSIGVLWIHYKEPRQFLPAQIEALKLYASQATIAYDNARRMQELKHLRRAAEKLASVAGVQNVLQQVVRSAREVLGADSSIIWSYDAVRDTFFPDELIADGIEPELMERFREYEPHPGGTAEIVMRQKYLAITDIDNPQYTFFDSSARGLRGAIGAKAFQGIALQVGDETLGVLYVNYKQPVSFSDEDRATLETFAYHAALTLKKARLLEQVSRARDTAKVVAEVSVLEDLRSTLNSIAKGTQDALHCDAVTLYIYDQIRDEFGFPPAMAGVRDMSEVLKFGLVARESVTRKILALDAVHVAEDAPSDPLMSGAFVKREEVKSSVGIPLKVGDRKVGVMFVNYRSSHRFTTDELTNIELFANQASVAIRNAQLYDELQKRAAALQALYEAGRAVTGTLSLDEILRRIVEQAWRLAEPRGKLTHFSYLALVDGNKVRFTAAYPQDVLPKLRAKVGEIDLEHDEPIGITGRAVKTRKPQLVVDTTDDRDYIEFDDKVHSQLSVPIKIGGQVSGVINVEHPEYNAFDEENQRALEALAAQAAIAIQNARRYEELKKTRETLAAKAAVAWMGMVSATWGHTVGNQATTIIDNIQLLRSAVAADASPERVKILLDRIETVARTIQSTVITTPLSAEEGTELVPIRAFLRERVKRLRTSYKEADVKWELILNLPGEAEVRVGRLWLMRVLDILVQNAIEAMKEAPQRVLTISTRALGNKVGILVSDTGKGIPPEIHDKLFKEPIPASTDSRGSGLGLLLVQTILQTYGGDIALSSSDKEGTTMVIRLPYKQT